MTDIESQIVNLLNKGWSYSQIQDELQVSSKTIAATRKAHFPFTESCNDALSNTAFQKQLKPQPFTNIAKSNTNPQKINLKTVKTMSNENDYNNDGIELSSQLELEKYRIKLAHELEMEKLKATREDKIREHDLREREIEREERKPEEEKRNLLYRIKKVVESCEDGEYSYDEADDLLEEARKVLSESEQYCFIHQITFQGSVSQTLLSKVIATLTEFLDGMDEDDSDELKFDSAFRRQVSRATFQTF